MVWRHILQAVQAAHLGGAHVCGFSADIVKAFNDLPRLPALTAVKLLGVDQPTLCAWAGALAGFQRHFVIRGSYSPGVLSTNGFPEGCALSCLAMVGLTHLFHLWMRACDASIRPISYVDNWELLMSTPQVMQRACEAVDKFAALLHIRLDAQKSYAWASDASDRGFLRAAGFRVVNATRDLGAHVVYTEQLSNRTSLERIEGLADFWRKLSRASCTFRQKISLVIRAAWPRALHAVSAVVLGKKHFVTLRTEVMKSLGLSKPGASPDLQCSLESLLFDPQVFAIIETVRDARSLQGHGHTVLDLEVGPLGVEKPVYNSVSEILCQRLH